MVHAGQLKQMEGLTSLRLSHDQVVGRVKGLKQELANWRVGVESHLGALRHELDGLQESLAAEMGALRGDLKEMKERISQELAASAELLAWQDLGTRTAGEGGGSGGECMEEGTSE
jgi:hypothetical protein